MQMMNADDEQLSFQFSNGRLGDDANFHMCVLLFGVASAG
jgi:hypothetical protein